MHQPDKKAVEAFIASCEGKPAALTGLDKLGEGWHGIGWMATYTILEDRAAPEKKVVIRAIRPEGFGHDFASDRAGSLLLQDALSRVVPGHIRSIGVGALSAQGIVRVPADAEFVQAVEVATGATYGSRFNTLTASPAELDESRRLAQYLLDLHSKKATLPEPQARSTYKRVLRDCMGHGEMLMGVLDTYPKESLAWLTGKERAQLLYHAELLRQKLEDNHARLCRVHGDFHQHNIMLSEPSANDPADNGITLLDASRFIWGEPADDVICMGINYLHQAIRTTGRFTGPYRELFDEFYNTYVEASHDKAIEQVIPLFFAFRSVVVAHPVFIPDQSDDVRRTMVMLALGLLKEGRFSTRLVDRLLDTMAAQKPSTGDAGGAGA
ncbi:hypothetical protein AUJ68_02010 [Candidatus Woesearchaeota archaeon CG1_02_57_44]|nr:MAG: hypothetical protein AUJ68_02010 [Candidatus Woesearchaeota archaeon CG1_02_57_44]